jgi:hypothetical protein
MELRLQPLEIRELASSLSLYENYYIAAKPRINAGERASGRGDFRIAWKIG